MVASNLIFVDFETRYSSVSGYDLKALNITEYIRDPRFKAWGLSYVLLDGEVKWVRGPDIAAWAKQFDLNNRIVVCHNAKFDGAILEWVYGVRPIGYICTQAMSKAILGKTVKSHSLAYLAEHFGLVSKGVMKTDGLEEPTPEQETELLTYGCHDTWLCREIFKRFEPEFPENQYKFLSWTITTFCRPRLELDVPMLRKAAADEIRAKRKRFREMGIDGGVFRSQPKFLALLKERGFECPMKPSPKKKDAEGKPVMIPALAKNDVAFIEFKEQASPELTELLDARVMSKSNQIQTRSLSLAKVGATGLFPADIGFSGADQTQRMSSGDNSGGNFQNYTKKSVLRNATMAMKGHSFISCDAAQIEARIAAYLANDSWLINIIENRPDLYCDFGTEYFERTITKDDERERNFSKVAMLALQYQQAGEGFKNQVKRQTKETISDDDANRGVSLYRSRATGVVALWKRLNEWIAHLADGSMGQFAGLPLRYGREYIELPSGLRMKYPNLHQEERIDRKTGEVKLDRYGKVQKEWVYEVWDKNNVERRRLYGGKILENICQALAGEFLKGATEPFLDVMTATIHDDAHLVVPRPLARPYGARLKAAMEIAPHWLPRMVLKADLKIGTSWGNCK